MSLDNNRLPCNGACGWNARGESILCDGGAGYSKAVMLSANISEFHSNELREASQAIEAALERVRGNANGRTLSFINTGSGTLLAWVNHEDVVPAGGVTIDSDFEDIVEALGLIVPEDSAA